MHLQRHDKSQSQETHGVQVHRQSGAPEIPASGEERLASQALERETPDGDHVGENERCVRDGEDGVECDLGALRLYQN